MHDRDDIPIVASPSFKAKCGSIGNEENTHGVSDRCFRVERRRLPNVACVGLLLVTRLLCVARGLASPHADNSRLTLHTWHSTLPEYERLHASGDASRLQTCTIFELARCFSLRMSKTTTVFRVFYTLDKNIRASPQFECSAGRTSSWFCSERFTNTRDCFAEF